MDTPKFFQSRGTVEWILRFGAFMCFVGHGAFGIITREAWVRYFGVVGIGRDFAYTLMPLVGSLDITMGVLILVAPVPAAGWWMLLWAVWTALLRPLSGEPFWEALERAGNYGIPVALLVIMTHGASLRNGFRRGFRELTPDVMLLLRRVLTVAVVLLLVGHGALGLISKPGLVANYASIMPASLAARATPWLGALEIALAIVALARPSFALFLFIAAWKIATESLFITAGSAAWEFVERGGSYAAPLVLAVLCRMTPATAHDSPAVRQPEAAQRDVQKSRQVARSLAE